MFREYQEILNPFLFIFEASELRSCKLSTNRLNNWELLSFQALMAIVFA